MSSGSTGEPKPTVVGPAAPSDLNGSDADDEKAESAAESGRGKTKVAKATPKPGEPASLELVVNPPVNVVIDGKGVGKSPIHIPLRPGVHSLSLVDTSEGISLTRKLNIKEKGKTRESIEIGKGSVVINAPDGAVAFLDGKNVGTAPLKAIPAYEGNHRILVNMKGAKWQQRFALGSGETMTFDVYQTEQAASEQQ